MKPAKWMLASFALWHGAQWLGCGGDAGTLTAMHVLPGGASDREGADFFAMPFPSDARIKKSVSSLPAGADLSRWPVPLGQPGVYVKFLDGRVTAAGPSAAIYFRFSGALAESSLPQDAAESVTAEASAYVIDVTPNSPTFGAKAPMIAAFHRDEGQFIGANWMSLRPVPGIPLRENTTYAAVLTGKLRGEKGERIVASRAADGSYAMIYLPVGKTISVHTKNLKATELVCWWYDPRSGKAKKIGKMARQPEMTFTPPKQGQEQDWVLVLDDAKAGFEAPGARKKQR